MSSQRTWEWSSASRARSVIFPLMSSGVPYFILRFIRDTLEFDNALTPESLLILPRVWMGIQSLFIDLFVYRIADEYYDCPKRAKFTTVMFASSYLALVYCTRTFSNSTEMLLLAALLYYTRPKREYTERTVSNEFFDPQSDIIAQIFCFGCFIRPSFAAFAIFPVLLWSLHTTSHQSVSMMSTAMVIAVRAVKFITSYLICFLFLAVLDTAYYEQKIINDFLMSKPFFNYRSVMKLVSSLTITPINNLLYNIQRGNLEAHGLHPFYTHTFANLPMLFGPLLIAFTFACTSIVSQIRNQVMLKVDKYIFLQLLGTFAVSMFLLSGVPHQEPRFILPLFIPVVVISTNWFFTVPMKWAKILLAFCVVFNVAGLMFFGFIHQAGVVPCISSWMYYDIHYRGGATHSSNELPNVFAPPTPNSLKVTYMFYHTYMPPTHLLGLPKGNHIRTYDDKDLHVKVIDLSGASINQLITELDDALDHSEVFLIMPSSVPCEHQKMINSQFRFQGRFGMFPHFSSEDPPWRDWLRCWKRQSFGSGFHINMAECNSCNELFQDYDPLSIWSILDRMSISIRRVDYKDRKARESMDNLSNSVIKVDIPKPTRVQSSSS